MPKKVNACLKKKGSRVRTLKSGKLICFSDGESVVWEREKKPAKKGKKS